MNEKRKMFILLAIISIFFVLIFFLVYDKEKKQNEIYDQFIAAFNGSENTLIYIGRPDCKYCNLLNPSLEDMKKRYNFEYLYINTNETDISIMEKISDDLSLDRIGTPYLTIVSNGKVIDKQNGYSDYDVTFEFLKKNGIIKEDANLLLNYINYEEYTRLKDTNDLNVIMIGKSDDIYSVQTKVVLNQIAEDNKLNISFMSLSFLSDDEYKNVEDEFGSLVDLTKPIVVIMQGDKIVNIISGAASYDNYYKFLKGNGVLQ